MQLALWIVQGFLVIAGFNFMFKSFRFKGGNAEQIFKRLNFYLLFLAANLVGVIRAASDGGADNVVLGASVGLIWLVLITFSVIELEMVSERRAYLRR